MVGWPPGSVPPTDERTEDPMPPEDAASGPVDPPVTSLPRTFRLGRYRFSYKWRVWGCDRGGDGCYGHRSPWAAFRAVGRARRQRIEDGNAALYREKMRNAGLW